jgi:hypothetical protein
MSKSYPLSPLIKLREGRVDAASRDVSAANSAASARTQVRIAATEKSESHREMMRVTLENERVALEAGVRNVAELRQVAEWEACAELTQAHLADHVAVREEEERKALAVVARARAVLAQRRADTRVIEQHRDAWQAERRRAAENQLEEEVADIHAGRRKGDG